MIDPRLRQRVETVAVRPTVVQHQSNGEILAAFRRHLSGKVIEKTVGQYVRVVEDAMAFFREEKQEIPVRRWTKEQVGSFLVYVEQNYCASFNPVPFRAGMVTCRQRVWIGPRPAVEAAQEACRTCPSFKRLNLKGRLNALHRFYKYLARVGIVPYNFVTDLMREYSEDHPQDDDGQEKRRNPTIEEVVRLVNGTGDAQRRFYYALNAKNGPRPNEAFMLDRFASFGLPMPEGVRMPLGFEHGFLEHPEALEPHSEGDLYYIPEKYDQESGRRLKDKRKGNRWGVIDSEVRPLRDAHFAWWDMHVKRDETGRPLTTCLWLNKRGLALKQEEMYDAGFFYNDAERLGIMEPGDRDDPRRRLTSHGKRHFLQRLCQMYDMPSDWNNHIRGDKFRDARGHYYKPPPNDLRTKYLQFIPRLGFKPVPDAGWIDGTEGGIETHLALLQAEKTRVLGMGRYAVHARCMELASRSESLVVPRRIAASILHAFQVEDSGAGWEARPLPGPAGIRDVEKAWLVGVLDRALGAFA